MKERTVYKLKVWMAKNSMTYAILADRLGVTRDWLYQIFIAGRFAGKKFAENLEKITNGAIRATEITNPLRKKYVRKSNICPTCHRKYSNPVRGKEENEEIEFTDNCEPTKAEEKRKKKEGRISWS